MDFSIIIPAKNELVNLKRTLPQYKKIPPGFSYEVIVADGKSDDGSIELARTLANRVEVKSKDGRETIGEGRNRGARVARGNILIFFDASVAVDDVPKFFTAVGRVFKDKKIVAATTNVRIDPHIANWQDVLIHAFVNSLVRLINALGLGAGKGEAQIVRAAAFRKLGGYNEKLAAAEDNELFWRLARMGRIIFLKDLQVFDDPRRYRKLGYPRVIAMWILNQFSVMIRGRSFSKEWKRID